MEDDISVTPAIQAMMKFALICFISLHKSQTYQSLSIILSKVI